MGLFDKLKKKNQTLGDQLDETITKDDLIKMQKTLAREQAKLQDKSEDKKNAIKAGQTLVGSVKSGFNSIIKSMDHPYAPGHRPKISQMPAKSDIKNELLRSPNYEGLKDRGLRGKDIRGKRITGGKL